MARRFTRLCAVALVLGAMGGDTALAEDAAPGPAPASPPPTIPTPTPEPSWFTPPAGAVCRQWSDGCHVCTRASTDAETSCSTPSIACVQTALRCLEPQPSAQ
ncbi:hypothetical protein G3545_10980 [Starkeya sp. ORNL1]|uniref:hypothetical protein n=1 Tax=Starkeya sp. ORNL1 TaxID=2709380 RepID=UPI0014643C50|nr:hypothetical protein [Starkeya sp. ORNL1]QJP14126.1 hypothetical protein G3545_10980 [Starkeya sp. ORNL1]